jgi:hypothetical protein
MHHILLKFSKNEISYSYITNTFDICIYMVNQRIL